MRCAGGNLAQEPGAAGRGIALAQLLQLPDQCAHPAVTVVQQHLEPCLLRLQLLPFRVQTLPLQAGEPSQGHGQHRLRLNRTETKLHLERRRGSGCFRRLADEQNHLLQLGQGLEQPFDHLQPLADFVQGKAVAAQGGLLPELQKDLKNTPQAQLGGLAIHKSQENGAEIALQGGAAEQLLQHNLRLTIPAQFNHHPHAFPVTLITDVGDAAEAPVIDLLRQLFNPTGLAELVGQLCHHDSIATTTTLTRPDGFQMGHTPHLDAAPPLHVGLTQAMAHGNFPARRKVGAGDQSQQCFIAQSGVPQECHQAIHNFPQVVGGDVGGHAHGNAGAAVEQKDRQLSRQNGRFLLGSIEIGREVHRVLRQFPQQGPMGQRCQAGFRIAHRRRRIVVQRTKVAVALQKGVAAGEGLHLTHQGVIDCGFTVGMVFPQDVSHHPGTLAERTLRRQAQLMHGVENAALHRLQAISHIGQGAAHDHAHGVFQVGALHLLSQRGGDDAIADHAA